MKLKIIGILIVLIITLSCTVAYGYDYLGIDPDIDKSTILDDMSISDIIDYYGDDAFIEYFSDQYADYELLDKFGIDDGYLVDHFYEKYSEQELSEIFDIRNTTIDDLVYDDLYWNLIGDQIIPDMGDTLARISFICPDKMSFFFDLAEEFGCEPSMILGKYCEDYENDVIHLTDNAIKEGIAFENMGFPIINYPLSDVKEKMKDKDEWEFYGFSLCPHCFK